MLSHWPCVTWKFLIIWFHKNLKLIFQKPSSSPGNTHTHTHTYIYIYIYIYILNTEENYLPWQSSCKFSCTLRKTILWNMCKKFFWLCYPFISKLKERFHTGSDWSGYFEFSFWFSSAILLSKMKSLFLSLWKFAKFLMSFLKT